MDPYGSAWDIRFNISYYLYALIFLAFDVDILYLFPVAAAYDKVSALRGVIELFIFIAILSLAIIYAWAKGVFLGRKKKSPLRVHSYAELAHSREESGLYHPPESYGEPAIRMELVEKILNLCRANSLWPMTFGAACCAIEMMSLGMARFDMSRYGAKVFRPYPRQCDLMIVAGTINKKMAPEGENLSFDSLAGLYRRSPLLAFTLAARFS